MMIAKLMRIERIKLTAFLFGLVFGIMLCSPAIAQDKVSLRVKAFDQDLKPLPNIQIAFNELDYFEIGGKGATIIEIDQSEIPIKAVRVKDERFEAASWNLSKGTIEIIVRPVSYKVMHVSIRFPDGTPVPNTPLSFRGSTIINVTSDRSGNVDVPISLYENISSVEQFTVDKVVLSNMTVNGDQITLVAERPRVPPQRESNSKPTAPAFDIARLDSISSLAEFYAIFRNISINNLDDNSRALVDEKFRQLVAQRQDSIRANQAIFLRNISDSSMVVEDIENLLKQAKAESNTLRTNRQDFESKIVMISSKLRRGVVNLTEPERKTLLQDIDMLEQLLTENESQFYENHNDYREIINALREKYLDIQQLQTQLSEVERLRDEQNREFRQRLVGIGTVVVLFGFLIILLITFSSRLRRRTKSLTNANERIEQINENLEAMVARRTSLLEETNKELDTFLYRASHDLRAPVVSLVGLCQIIEHIGREEMISHVQLATNTMNRLINKLIDISEIAQEVQSVRTVRVLDIINRVRNKQLVMMVATNGSRVSPIIVRKMPVQLDIDCPENIEIYTSPSLLEIALNNLVENAVFFGGLKKTNVAIRVDIKASIHNGNLALTVNDNGVGISNAIKPRIFNMFFTGNVESKGSGLGLYTVKKCVTALQGTISLDSEEGKFTRFTMVIPPSAVVVREAVRAITET
jgi:signal transduction histidine kinase